MFAIIAAALGISDSLPATAPPPVGQTAWVVATVDHSEWCPAGNVRLDLVTGNYDYTPGLGRRRVCNDAKVQRPIQHGKLKHDQLASIRAKYLSALAQGLELKVCRDGGRPEDIVISNGGVPILVVTDGRRSISAPGDLSCWNEAADTLQDTIDEVFGPGQ